MKILIVSDSHGDFKSLDKLVNMYPKMDLYIHCGDSEDDEFHLMPFVSVRGNCDTYYDFQDHLLVSTPFGNMYVQHRPLYSYDKIKQENATIFVHGHTHTRKKSIENGIHVYNPGAVSYARDKYEGSYLILDISKDKIVSKFGVIK